ncbi:MAG: universal stress protein [Thermodesulfobacteriota bacterium]
MFKNILIPLDGSSHSSSALNYGVFLAKKLHATLTGHQVVDMIALEGPFLHDLSGSLGFEPFLNFSSKMRDVLEEKGKKMLEDFEKECKKDKVKCEKLLDFGIISNEICERAKIADLVIIGRRGINAKFEHGLLGSTTEAVIRKSPRPVMIVPESFEEIKKPLLVYDGGFTASRVMRIAAELTRLLKTPLTVLTMSKDGDNSSLKEAEEYLRPYKLNVDFVSLKGKASEEIVGYYTDNLHDLIFAGASAHGRIVEMVLGSTTEFILRRVKGPIILER